MKSETQLKLKNIADNFRQKPDEKVWLKLENMLEKERNKNSIKKYRTLLTIAASFIVVFGILSLMILQNNSNAQHEYRPSELMTMQDDTANDSKEGSIYEIDKLRELKTAYAKLGMKNKF